MDTIIRGTTPTIQFKYSEISVADIVAAVLCVKQGGSIIIEKTLDSATIADGSISWSLSQEETLKLSSGPIHETKVVCDWKTTSGLRGRSKTLTCSVGEPAKSEVL